MEIVFISAIIIAIVVIYLVKKTGSIETTVKTKLKTYYQLRSAYPDINRKELYKKIIEIRPTFEDKSDEILEECGEDCNFRSVVFWICYEEYMPGGSLQYSHEVIDRMTEEIWKNINKYIPKEL